MRYNNLRFNDTEKQVIQRPESNFRVKSTPSPIWFWAHLTRKRKSKNYKQYLMCKFTRFMLRLTYSSMHIARANFGFVPNQDFTETWTDEKLYKKYELTEDEIAFIESTIRVME